MPIKKKKPGIQTRKADVKTKQKQEYKRDERREKRIDIKSYGSQLLNVQESICVM